MGEPYEDRWRDFSSDFKRDTERFLDSPLTKSLEHMARYLPSFGARFDTNLDADPRFVREHRLAVEYIQAKERALYQVKFHWDEEGLELEHELIRYLNGFLSFPNVIQHDPQGEDCFMVHVPSDALLTNDQSTAETRDFLEQKAVAWALLQGTSLTVKLVPFWTR